jgi:8-amino-7-oxononanoate synthase
VSTHPEFDSQLAEELSILEAKDLLRRLRQVDSPQGSRIRIGGRELRNFSSNDYLALANEPVVKEAALEALEKFGAGAGASRLICGSLAPHHELEQTLASFKRTEAALSFSSGYATALGTIPALLGRDDVIVIDRLIHACIVDAARLSGAQIRVFRHNDPDNLEKILRQVERKSSYKQPTVPSKRRRVLIVTESVFSMNGDQAQLVELVQLKEKYGAWLMVDEAHATGLFGPKGQGLVQAHELDGRIEIQMGTLGKALGSAGGYICGSRLLVDFLLNRARSFVFSTAPVPSASAAAAAAVKFVQSPPAAERRQRLWRNVSQLRLGLSTSNLENSSSHVTSAIVPVIIGVEAEALRAAGSLLDQGCFVPAIRYPTVARGQARLRITLTAAHSTEDVQQLLDSIPGANWT